jgi:hypothetical protein
MEKELLERRKVALNKLLENRTDFWSGLCNFTAVLNTKNILTDEEYEIITDLLCEFRTTNAEARENYLNGGFLWEPGEWEPREEWINFMLEEINAQIDSLKK